MGSSLLLWLVLLAPPATQAAAPAAQSSKEKPVEKPVVGPAQPRELLPEYVIGPGDALQLFVWKEVELTRALQVRIDGRITVPLLGDIVADGKTPMQLASEIATALGRFIETPVVNVIVGQESSAKIYVIGEVKNAGALSMTGRMTILTVVALSGGFAQFADTDSILLIRGRQTIKINYDKIKDGSDLAQNLVMLPGDTVVVP
jgi:polysaccharide export outer membrane protein